MNKKQKLLLIIWYLKHSPCDFSPLFLKMLIMISYLLLSESFSFFCSVLSIWYSMIPSSYQRVYIYLSVNYSTIYLLDDPDQTENISSFIVHHLLTIFHDLFCLRINFTGCKLFVYCLDNNDYHFSILRQVNCLSETLNQCEI